VIAGVTGTNSLAPSQASGKSAPLALMEEVRLLTPWRGGKAGSKTQHCIWDISGQRLCVRPHI